MHSEFLEVSTRNGGPTPPETSCPQRHHISTVSLAAIVFYTVSGGPFGIEDSVRAAGPLLAILGFMIMPLIWSLPEALITAELGAAYPQASGCVVWVEEAFGKSAGWVCGVLSWVSGATDNAIYPVLFMDYWLQGGTFEQTLLARFGMLSSVSIVLAFINYRGLKVVGNVAMLICVVAMSPFVVFCVLGVFKVDANKWFVGPVLEHQISPDDDDRGISMAWYHRVLWAPFLNNLFWNLNSFDSAACFSGEVANPGYSFPRAMFLALLMCATCYLLPLLVALGADTGPQADWTDGYLANVASNVVGKWLGAWVVFAAAINNIALFQAEMSSDAFQIMGMADRGFLPRIFSTRSPHGTPTYGIVLGAAVIVAMSVADFETLVELVNFNYAVSLVMEFAAFIKLRIAKPNRTYTLSILYVYESKKTANPLGSSQTLPDPSQHHRLRFNADPWSVFPRICVVHCELHVLRILSAYNSAGNCSQGYIP
jgi:amino acid transporter